MNGEMAQLVALATHGTAWLRTRDGSPAPDLDRQHATFKFLRSATFVGAGGHSDGVANWLVDLRRRGVERLWLVVDDPPPVRQRWPHLAAHLAVAFANGGEWQLLAAGPEVNELWLPRWEVDDIKAADRRIWTARFDAQEARGVRPRRPELDETAKALRATIEAARSLAAREFPDWTESFDDALFAVAPRYHPDLVPSSFPEAARRLVAMCSAAWVFGGMGSWNDVAYPNSAVEKEHGDISRALYSAILLALLAAVNCDLD